MGGSGERESEDRDAIARQFKLALAQLPARMHGGVRLFRRLTGFTAVTNFRAAVGDPRELGTLAPPVHPRCASQIRKVKLEAPCAEQWRWHLRVGLSSRAAHGHVCALGLRCSCVPIFFGETLVGTAKVVAGAETTDRRFSLAAQTLELVVSKVCSEVHVLALSEELWATRRKLEVLRETRRTSGVERDDGGRAAGGGSRPTTAGHASLLVDQALDYLGGHFLDPALSLAEVSRALGVNDKYLTRIFTASVGQHMRAYIVELRVHHACRLLLSTGKAVKEIAHESGFRRPDHFRRAFREHVGLPPAVYRRTFTSA